LRQCSGSKEYHVSLQSYIHTPYSKSYSAQKERDAQCYVSETIGPEDIIITYLR